MAVGHLRGDLGRGLLGRRLRLRLGLRRRLGLEEIGPARVDRRRIDLVALADLVDERRVHPEAAEALDLGCELAGIGVALCALRLPVPTQALPPPLRSRSARLPQASATPRRD